MSIRFAAPLRLGSRFLERAVAFRGDRSTKALYFCRGYLDFPPGTAYGRHLHRMGFSTQVVSYSSRGLVDRTARSWIDNLGRVSRNLLDDPLGPEPGSIFVGHSHGGLVVAGLGAIAKTDRLEAIWLAFPQFLRAGVTLDDLARLQVILREGAARYVSVATPFHGVETRSPLSVLSGLATYFRLFAPLRDTGPEEIRRFFRIANINTESIIDANLYGVGGDPTSLVRACMRMGAGLFFRGGSKGARNDCLLLEETMRLGIPNEMVLDEIDHWMIVKLRKGAEGLVQALRGLS